MDAINKINTSKLIILLKDYCQFSKKKRKRIVFIIIIVLNAAGVGVQIIKKKLQMNVTTLHTNSSVHNLEKFYTQESVQISEGSKKNQTIRCRNVPTTSFTFP